jgi:phosphatidylserine decarboxylase
METIEKWLESSVKPFLKQSTEKEDYDSFMRDECRPIIKDEKNFYSCADGVVLYNKIVKNCDVEVEVKGVPYSVNEILGIDDMVEGPALICGVFMTFADIHLNRVPYSGLHTWKMLQPIESFNMSMDATEEKLFGDLRRGRVSPRNFNNRYLQNNARCLNRFYIPEYDYSYYIVQIADYDVDVIQHFNMIQNKVAHQGNRFSFIRWGSQCDLVMPLRKDLNIKPLIKPMFHVEAGVDKVASFI